MGSSEKIEFNVIYDIKYSEYAFPTDEFDFWYTPWFGRAWIEVVGRPQGRAEMDSVVSKWKWLCTLKIKIRARRCARLNRKKMTHVRFEERR